MRMGTRDRGWRDIPLPGERTKHRQRVLILARDMCVYKRNKVRQKCSKRDRVCVGGLRGEMTLLGREVEDDDRSTVQVRAARAARKRMWASWDLEREA